MLYLLLVYAAMRYLKAVWRRDFEGTEAALTPESIIGTDSDWQADAWPTDCSQGIPQGDASSLPVDRSMQQPRHEQSEHNIHELFSDVRDLKQKLYGSDANTTIKGERDLATAAAEIDRSGIALSKLLLVVDIRTNRPVTKCIALMQEHSRQAQSVMPIQTSFTGMPASKCFRHWSHAAC